MTTLTIPPSALLNRLGSPLVASLGLGLAFSSYFFLGNLACATMGVMPSLKAVKLEDEKKVELWAFWYGAAAPQFATTTLLSSLSYFTAAYLSDEPALKPWLTIAGLCSLFIPPWTLLIMAENNNALLAARARVVRNEKLGMTSQDVVRRLELWTKLHLVRIVVGGVAWGIGLGAVILA